MPSFTAIKEEAIKQAKENSNVIIPALIGAVTPYAIKYLRAILEELRE